MAFASPEIIGLMNKIKYPYNVNRLTQQEAIHMLYKHPQVLQWIKSLQEERTRMMEEFRKLPCCQTIFPTDANFFLTRVTDANAIYNYLVHQESSCATVHTSASVKTVCESPSERGRKTTPCWKH